MTLVDLIALTGFIPQWRGWIQDATGQWHHDKQLVGHHTVSGDCFRASLAVDAEILHA